ncbi:zinc finger BED domain-containing protein RICESLEEPER 2-like [Amaranthus tricolor]|uniref:zinc finger BED domain-containing protein RICESLEEPER 2-like n=1 Tax=Amaranthus tricolor TaxID=29722 RepID=UPI002585DF83|nr:zinc finger BED domain-containing protein RICESLEEPER 2-like [Amaranthus tricolor]
MDENQSQCTSKSVAQPQNDFGMESKNTLNVDEEGFINDNVDGIPSSCTKDKGRKTTSEAWNYFVREEVNGVTRAVCKRCGVSLVTSGSSGTSHLLKHTKKVCSGRHLNLACGQTTLRVKKKCDGSSSLEYSGKSNLKEFDQEFSRRELVSMVIMHEYPLSMVDHIGFRRFVESLNSNFKMISRSTLKRDIMKMFKEEKLSLHKLLDHNESRIAITTDMWTVTNQKKGYMVITSHFIDKQWVLRNRTLRFCYVPCPHTGGVIAKVMMDCLSQYCLENKISAVVVDNATTNDAMMKILMNKFEKRSLMLEVQDGLGVISSAIEKVRDCVSFWMSTPKRIENFEEACRFLDLVNIKKPSIDCKTRWNSTYLMLKSVLTFKDVFSRLRRVNKKMNFVVPSDKDWELAELGL